MSQPIIATYGHGTENDFLLLFDPENKISISASQIAAMCNRSQGIGADGFIRICKDGPHWFMDYYNADGSVAEMCGNGIRVMARYLVTRGLQPEGIFAIDTRAGVKHLRVPLNDDISVNMGSLEVLANDIEVECNGMKWESGYNVNVGNPHAVVFVDDVDAVGSLKHAPTVRPRELYPDGVNVEFEQFTADHVVKMRVHERGSGETQSCGTGVVAVARAAAKHVKDSLPTKWEVNVPGGRLFVEIDAHNNGILTGPAVIVKDVQIEEFLER